MKRALLLFTLAATLPIHAANEKASEYTATIDQWRRDRETRLKAEDGWLSVSGLFWLKQGPNTVGSSDKSQVRLPKPAPAQVGTLRLTGKAVTIAPRAGVPVLVNGKPPSSTPLKPDSAPTPDILEIAGLKLLVLERGDRVAIRLKDPNSVYRRNFAGLDWYPVKPDWLVRARWVPFEQPRKRSIQLMTGDKEQVTEPGYAEFDVSGRKVRLTPSQEGDKLFFVFRDRTAGKTTYAAARFLYAELPKDGVVNLDFNKAYNPPCTFTPYATCPLPTAENRLGIAIDAGERMYKGAH